MMADSSSASLRCDVSNVTDGATNAAPASKTSRSTSRTSRTASHVAPDDAFRGPSPSDSDCDFERIPSPSDESAYGGGAVGVVGVHPVISSLIPSAFSAITTSSIPSSIDGLSTASTQSTSASLSTPSQQSTPASQCTPSPQFTTAPQSTLAAQTTPASQGLFQLPLITSSMISSPDLDGAFPPPNHMTPQSFSPVRPSVMTTQVQCTSGPHNLGAISPSVLAPQHFNPTVRPKKTPQPPGVDGTSNLAPQNFVNASHFSMSEASVIVGPLIPSPQPLFQQPNLPPTAQYQMAAPPPYSPGPHIFDGRITPASISPSAAIPATTLISSGGHIYPPNLAPQNFHSNNPGALPPVFQGAFPGFPPTSIPGAFPGPAMTQTPGQPPIQWIYHPQYGAYVPFILPEKSPIAAATHSPLSAALSAGLPDASFKGPPPNSSVSDAIVMASKFKDSLPCGGVIERVAPDEEVEEEDEEEEVREGGIDGCREEGREEDGEGRGGGSAGGASPLPIPYAVEYQDSDHQDDNFKNQQRVEQGSNNVHDAGVNLSEIDVDWATEAIEADADSEALIPMVKASSASLQSDRSHLSPDVTQLSSEPSQSAAISEPASETEVLKVHDNFPTAQAHFQLPVTHLPQSDIQQQYNPGQAINPWADHGVISCMPPIGHLMLPHMSGTSMMQGFPSREMLHISMIPKNLNGETAPPFKSKENEEITKLRSKLDELQLPKDLQKVIIDEEEFNTLHLFAEITPDDIEEMFKKIGLSRGKKKRLDNAIAEVKKYLNKNDEVTKASSKIFPSDNQDDEADEYVDASNEIPKVEKGKNTEPIDVSYLKSSSVEKEVHLQPGKYLVKNTSKTSIQLKWNTENSNHGAAYSVAWQKETSNLLDYLHREKEKTSINECETTIDNLDTLRKYTFTIKEIYLKEKSNTIKTQPILIGTKPTSLEWVNVDNSKGIRNGNKIKFTCRAPVDFGGFDSLKYNVEIWYPDKKERVYHDCYDSKSLYGVESFENNLSDKFGRCVLRVKAGNSIGDTNWLLSEIFLAGRIPEQPQEPLCVRVGRNMLSVSWKAPLENGGYPVMNYHVSIFENDTKRLETKFCPTTAVEFFNISSGIWNVEISANTEFGMGLPLRLKKIYVGSIPDKPQDCKLSYTRNSVTLTWDEPKDNGGLPLIRYDIAYSILDNKDTKTWLSADSVDAHLKRFTLPNIPERQEIQLKIRATNPIGTSDWYETPSIFTSDKPQAPQGPLNIFCVSPSLLSLSWKPPVDDGAADIMHYNVNLFLQTDECNSNWKELAKEQTEKEELMIEVPHIPNTVQLQCTVAACNRNGVGERLRSHPLYMVCPPSAPLGPIQFSDLTRNSVLLHWTKPEQDGGDDCLKYEIQHKIAGDKKWIMSEFKLNNSAALVENLPNGKEMTFAVTAINRNLGKSEKLLSEPIIIAGLPDPPSKLTVQKMKSDIFNLSWTQVKNDGGLPIIKYEVWYKGAKTNWNLLSTTKDFNLDNIKMNRGETCTFGIKSCNERGKSELATTDPSPVGSSPSAISQDSIVIKPSRDSCEITWNYPADDGGFPVQLYTVQSLVEDEKNWQSIPASFSNEKAVIENLIPGKQYFFRISAKNIIGCGESTITKDPVAIGGPPSEPLGPVKIREVTPENLIKLEWQPPKYSGGFQPIYKLTLLTKENIQPVKEIVDTNSFELMLKKYGLEFGERLHLEIIAINSCGASDKFTSHEILLSGPPDSPTFFEIPDDDLTDNSATLTWKCPDFDGGASIVNYVLESRKRGEIDWKLVKDNIDSAETSTTVHGLELRSTYEFRLCAENSVGKSKFVNHPAVVLPHPAQRLMKKCEKINEIPGHPSVYLLPVDEVAAKGEMQKFQINVSSDGSGSSSILNPKEKVLLVVGETGGGKSTFINGLINHAYGVQFDDSFRFKLIRDSTNQTVSQTKNISAYVIPKEKGSILDFTLTVIDTPGFGDTNGIERDREIENQLRDFFKNQEGCGVDQVHAICFIVQASHARLTPAQTYIFSSILAMFGKDTAKNFLILFTFADAIEPPALGAVKEAKIPFKTTFKLNNSALYCNNTSKDHSTKFNEMFWTMGMESYNELFKQMETMEPVSLSLTQEVMETRESLENLLEELIKSQKTGLDILNECKQEYDVIMKHQRDINDNKSFEYEVDKTEFEKIKTDPGTYDTNCLICQTTCHYPCRIPNDDQKFNCASMDRKSNPTNPNCAVCPGKCNWREHNNVGYKIVSKVVKKKQTYAEMQQKYKCALDGKVTAEKLLEKVKTRFIDAEKEVLRVINDTNKTLKHLADIALRKHELTTVKQIDLLIKGEKQEAKYGWEKRVESLQNIKKKAILIEKTNTAGFDPWEQWRQGKDMQAFWKSVFAGRK